MARGSFAGSFSRVASSRGDHYIAYMTGNTAPQPYARPPIVEAIVEVRFSTEVNEAKCKKASEVLGKRYENSFVESPLDVNIDFGTRKASFIDKPPVYRLTSSDQTDLCSIAVGAISWVRRAPYEGWKAFCGHLSPELAIALKSLGHPAIARIGLRYVNRIDVKPVNDVAHYEDFLNFKISHGDLLEPTSGFEWKLVKEFKDLGLKAIVQSAVVEPEIPGLAAFKFDIDVYTEEAGVLKSDEILDRLADMRKLKNTIFEAGITDRAREAYS